MNRNFEYSPESAFNVSYDGKSMMIVGCADKESKEIIIPPLIDDKPVTVIGNGAFRILRQSQAYRAAEACYKY